MFIDFLKVSDQAILPATFWFFYLSAYQSKQQQQTQTKIPNGAQMQEL